MFCGLNVKFCPQYPFLGPSLWCEGSGCWPCKWFHFRYICHISFPLISSSHFLSQLYNILSNKGFIAPDMISLKLKSVWIISMNCNSSNNSNCSIKSRRTYMSETCTREPVIIIILRDFATSRLEPPSLVSDFGLDRGLYSQQQSGIFMVSILCWVVY